MILITRDQVGRTIDSSYSDIEALVPNGTRAVKQLVHPGGRTGAEIPVHA